MTLFIAYHGPITLAGARHVESLLIDAAKANNDVILGLSSGGGDVNAGMGLYNFIRMLPNKVTTYAFGTCGSIAATLFLAGDRRISSPSNQFSLHAASYSDGPRKGEIADSTALIYQPFESRLHWKKPRIKKYFTSTQEKPLSPELAKEYGMVTDISELKLKPDDEIVTVNY